MYSNIKINKSKVVLFCGGKGSRLQEETQKIPKPLVEIGGMPIIWHIMKIYSFYGFNDFILCAGYKANLIKDYFYNYKIRQSDMTINLNNEDITFHNTHSENWNVSIFDTGENTLTGDRLKQVEKYLDKDEIFLLNYSDGLSDINIKDVIEYHKKQKDVMTLCGVQTEGKYGNINIESNGKVTNFEEKPKGDGKFINGGFFVCEPTLFNYLQKGDFADTLKFLSKEKKLSSYKHKGFWQCMDTLSEKENVEKLWNMNRAP